MGGSKSKIQYRAVSREDTRQIEVVFTDSTDFKTTIKQKIEKHSLCWFTFAVVLLSIVIVLSSLLIYTNLSPKIHSSAKKINNFDKYQVNETKSHDKHEQKNETNVDRIKTAVDMIEKMDRNVNPCDDFYQYACGGKVQDISIPDGFSSQGSFEILQKENDVTLRKILDGAIIDDNEKDPLLKKAAIMYQSCMNISSIKATGTAPLKEVIEKLGSWPVTNSDFQSVNWNSTKVMADYHKMIQAPLLLGITVSPDEKNNSNYAITFLKGSDVLEKNSYGNERNDLASDTYIAMATSMGANSKSLEYLNEAIKFNERLYRRYQTTFDGYQIHSYAYEKMTLMQFSVATKIPLKWLKNLLNMIFENGYEVQDTEMIISYRTYYISQAYKMFSNLSTEVQASYVILKVFEELAPYITISKSNKEPRWKTCLQITSKYYTPILVKHFAKRILDKTDKSFILEVTRNIKITFEENLKSIDWLDNATRKYALKKLATMEEHVVYPNYVLDDSFLWQIENIDPKYDEYLSNIIKGRTFRSKSQFNSIGKPVDHKIWEIKPFEANALNYFTKNRIAVPVGILRPPFYDKNAPPVVKFGSIGFIIGHEMAHEFDSTGIYRTYKGNRIESSWLTNRSLKSFKRKSKCLVEQYNAFKFFDSKMDGVGTLEENMADNGGLRFSFKAYKRWETAYGKIERLPGINLNPDELFFVGFAQTMCTRYKRDALYGSHSPRNIRINAAVQNNEDFSKAFNCSYGSPMNPVSKCRVW